VVSTAVSRSDRNPIDNAARLRHVATDLERLLLKTFFARAGRL
jgi:hypothetical protein